MKKVGLFASLLFIAVSAVPVHAAPLGFDLYFDESGNATYLDNTSGGPTQNGYSSAAGAATFLYQADTIGGTGSQVLIYKLPQLVINGPVDVYQEDNSAPSDVLWFTNSDDLAAALGGTYVYGLSSDEQGGDFGVQNANLMIFFSGDIGGSLLADSGFPTTVNVGSLQDATQEDANGNFIWLPGTNQYFGSSPESPEPATLSMFLLGGVGLGFGAWRRKRS